MAILLDIDGTIKDDFSEYYPRAKELLEDKRFNRWIEY